MSQVSVSWRAGRARFFVCARNGTLNFHHRKAWLISTRCSDNSTYTARRHTFDTIIISCHHLALICVESGRHVDAASSRHIHQTIMIAQNVQINANSQVPSLGKVHGVLLPPFPGKSCLRPLRPPPPSIVGIFGGATRLGPWAGNAAGRAQVAR
jgi:hypothetical protein